jgi:hypothetical protein
MYTYKENTIEIENEEEIINKSIVQKIEKDKFTSIVNETSNLNLLFYIIIKINNCSDDNETILKFIENQNLNDI